MNMMLNEIQIDALREVGNIGAGNAATSLSQLISKKVEMDVPQIDILTFDEMLQRVGSEESMVVAVLLKVFGDAPGNILFMMDYERAQNFSEIMLQGYKDCSEDIYMSLFQEIGNILGNSYLNAISKLTGLSLVSSVPAVAIDMLAAVLSTSFMDAEQYSDYILAIDTRFIEDNRESGGNFFYIPCPGSLNKILNKLGL